MHSHSPGTHVVKFQPIHYLFIGQASFLQDPGEVEFLNGKFSKIKKKKKIII